MTGRINFHEPIIHNYNNCPPIDDIDEGFNLALKEEFCNWYTYALLFAPFCKYWDEDDIINLKLIRSEVLAFLNYANRTLTNNQMKEQLYKLLYRQCDISNGKCKIIKLLPLGLLQKYVNIC